MSDASNPNYQFVENLIADMVDDTAYTYAIDTLASRLDSLEDKILEHERRWRWMEQNQFSTYSVIHNRHPSVWIRVIDEERNHG